MDRTARGGVYCVVYRSPRSAMNGWLSSLGLGCTRRADGADGRRGRPHVGGHLVLSRCGRPRCRPGGVADRLGPAFYPPRGRRPWSTGCSRSGPSGGLQSLADGLVPALADAAVYVIPSPTWDRTASADPVPPEVLLLLFTVFRFVALHRCSAPRTMAPTAGPAYGVSSVPLTAKTVNARDVSSGPQDQSEPRRRPPARPVWLRAGDFTARRRSHGHQRAGAAGLAACFADVRTCCNEP